MSVNYGVSFERAEGNWAAYVPDLPGCMTTSSTLEEARASIRQAIEGHLEPQRAFGELVPEPASLAGEVEIETAAQISA